MHYLLDTNICIYLIKSHPLSVLEKFKKTSPEAIAISSITFAELHYGVEKSQHHEKNRAALKKFTLPLEILPFDDLACLHYGKLRAYLEKIGQPIGPMDLMIAAHALSLKVTLVTNNEKEFIKVPHLSVENWAKL